MSFRIFNMNKLISYIKSNVFFKKKINNCQKSQLYLTNNHHYDFSLHVQKNIITFSCMF
jgi:hypothetical protein